MRDAVDVERRSRGRGCYGRLFPELPPAAVEAATLLPLGRRGGPCDRGRDDSIDGDAQADAVWPIFGQFIAHDITADRSPIDRTGSSEELTNFRGATADLESLYGPGPVDAPYMYERLNPAKLLLASSGVDLARNSEGVALIGDARNDSHLLISQMHVAFAKLHNRLVDDLRSDGCGAFDLFEKARKATIAQYRRIILTEFLPQLIGSPLTNELVEEGPRFFDVSAEEIRIPAEFSAAAYRYGHAQIRQRYRINANFGPVALFPDLVGFRPVASERAVDWSYFIGRNAQKASRISERLPRALLELPLEVSGVAAGEVYSSLAARDLARGPIGGIASGEEIARAIGVEPLARKTASLTTLGYSETPLWLYVLREAEVECAGERLGPVGGRIVGEVLVGILWRDKAAAGDHEEGSLTLADVLLQTQ